MIKRFGERETRLQFAKRIRENGKPVARSARFLRELCGIGSYRINTTREIVWGFKVLHGITCIFMDGERQINNDKNGIPLEKVFQSYRVILVPSKRV